MSFIQRELDRLHSALTEAKTSESYQQLYAAQQALAWATDPDCFKSPFDLLCPKPVSGASPDDPARA